MSKKFAGHNSYNTYNSNIAMLPGADIDLDVIARVAQKSALGVRGVLALENTFADGIAAAFGKDGRAHGVRVISEPDGCVLHISAVTKYGENIPEIAWNLQERVKKSIEELIGVRAKRVNVLIAGIRDAAVGKAGKSAKLGVRSDVKSSDHNIGEKSVENDAENNGGISGGLCGAPQKV